VFMKLQSKTHIVFLKLFGKFQNLWHVTMSGPISILSLLDGSKSCWQRLKYVKID